MKQALLLMLIGACLQAGCKQTQDTPNTVTVQPTQTQAVQPQQPTVKAAQSGLQIKFIRGQSTWSDREASAVEIANMGRQNITVKRVTVNGEDSWGIGRDKNAVNLEDGGEPGLHVQQGHAGQFATASPPNRVVLPVILKPGEVIYAGVLGTRRAVWAEVETDAGTYKSDAQVSAGP